MPSGGRQQQPRQQPQPTGGGTTTHVPKKWRRILAHAGPDRGPLLKLLLGGGGNLQSGGTNDGTPSWLGAAFDLGLGPTLLLGLLLATALGLAARGSIGDWLRKRSSS